MWLFFLNILSFNFVPTPKISLRLTRFRRSIVNCPAVLTNLTSYAAFLLDVRCAVQSGHVPVCCSCLSPMIVDLHNLFLWSTPVAQMLLSKVGKQTKRCGIVIYKYIQSNSWSQHSISCRTTFSLNPHLVEDAASFLLFHRDVV